MIKQFEECEIEDVNRKKMKDTLNHASMQTHIF